jgi:hypothetical protein
MSGTSGSQNPPNPLRPLVGTNDEGNNSIALNTKYTNNSGKMILVTAVFDCTVMTSGDTAQGSAKICPTGETLNDIADVGIEDYKGTTELELFCPVTFIVPNGYDWELGSAANGTGVVTLDICTIQTLD